MMKKRFIFGLLGIIIGISVNNSAFALVSATKYEILCAQTNIITGTVIDAKISPIKCDDDFSRVGLHDGVACLLGHSPGIVDFTVKINNVLGAKNQYNILIKNSISFSKNEIILLNISKSELEEKSLTSKKIAKMYADKEYIFYISINDRFLKNDTNNKDSLRHYYGDIIPFTELDFVKAMLLQGDGKSCPTSKNISND